eukprot:sb/3474642/
MNAHARASFKHKLEAWDLHQLVSFDPRNILLTHIQTSAVLVKHKDCFYPVFKTMAVTSLKILGTKTPQANLYYLQQTCPILILSTLTLNYFQITLTTGKTAQKIGFLKLSPPNAHACVLFKVRVDRIRIGQVCYR